MRKFLLPLIAVLFFSGTPVSTSAQQTRLQAREAEWKSYAVPKTNFTRHTDADKTVVFRAPADWQQQSTSLTFNGPYSANIRVLIQKIPEGYPLDDYFGATLRIVRDRSPGSDSVVTRQTKLQDVDAREMVLDAPNPEGELMRSIAWIAIYGPHAFGFNLQVPLANAAEVEPYFKAVVQSVVFDANNPTLNELRDAALKSAVSGPIDELESIVESLSGEPAQRNAAVSRLTAMFAAKPETAFDLLLDRRGLIRLAAVQAAAQSNNSTLTPFLWKLLDDREPLVSEAAARGLATAADVVPKILDNSMFGFQTEKIARIWPFMPKEKRNELLQLIFKETAVVPEPPPPAAAPPVKRAPSVSVRLKEMIAIVPGRPEPTLDSAVSQDPNTQIGALTLLSTTPPEEFKLPFERVLASKHDPLISVALQVAMFRGEPLPVAPLLKLLSTANKQLRRSAEDSLAVSATVADIPAVEALISKDGSRKEFDDELKFVIKKINFRNALATAKTQDERREIIQKTLADSTMAEFAWGHDCEAYPAGCAASPIDPKANFTIKTLGENLFPQKVTHYTAIPNPRQAVQKFYESLHGLQMDSPRSQASLLLMLTNVRKLMAQALSAPGGAEELIDYTGIDPDGPIVLGSWTAPRARDEIPLAQRRAILLRVKDRVRFERNVDSVNRLAGGFMRLTGIVGIASRIVPVVPAAIPFTAQAALTAEPTKPNKPALPLLHYSFTADKEWNGLKLRVIENRLIDSDSTVHSDVTYIAYVGDTAILVPDLASLRDLLSNASATDKRKLLADNNDFQQALESHGDILYFSDLNAVFGETGGKKETATTKVNERGALNLSGSAWENSYHIAFNESDWARPLLPFHPKELTAPRELLPASTIGYFLAKIDLVALLSSPSWGLFSKTEAAGIANIWALDFKQEILPELGPECGVVLTGLPNGSDFQTATWAAFCRLKSNKLADAFTAGKLLRGVGPTTDVAELKAGDDSYFVATRSGFLVVSNRAKVLASFDGKTNLAATRDYVRSIEKVPNGVIAFGGYNLEAAVASVNNGANEGLRGQVVNVLFSFANAFHSQNFYATATAGSVEAHSSVSMDREGRYAVADFSSLPSGTTITYAVLEPHGVPITDQRRLNSLVLRVRAKAPGPIDNIKDDLNSPTQTIEQKSPTELLVSVAARPAGAEKAVQLPVKDPEFAPYLKATPEFASDKQEVIDQAREIAGDDRDAWSVARKLATWTNKNLEWKAVASANPVETLATREADCSEFSALFIAMARSLGLPARMVSGLAYNGSSFGGHAWVEVWAGRWIELDPTWGTLFVDATHIRNATNALVASAALHLIDIEVVEAKHAVAEFQKSPRALAEHLNRVLPLSDKSEIEATIDLGILVDEHMGDGAWNKLNDSERERMWSAYRRIIDELLSYGKDDFGARRIRLTHIEEKGDEAEAICVTAPTNLLLKLRFVRRNDLWHLAEVVQTDTSLAIVTETLGPTILAIEKARAGEKAPANGLSDMVRVLFLLEKEPAKASRLAEDLLKPNPKETRLRLLLGFALLNQDKSAEGVKVLGELCAEGFAPAVYRLAGYYNDSDEDADLKKAYELYERYISLEPFDPRGFQQLAIAYDDAEKYEQAAALYRKAIEINPSDTSNYRGLISLVLLHNFSDDVKALLATGEKYQEADEDLFGSIVQDFFFIDETKTAEKFAASEPLRMKRSALANFALGEMLTDAGRYVQAERLLNTALQLYQGPVSVEKSSTAAEKNSAGAAKHSELADHNASDVYVALAKLYRKQSRWLTALKAADQAIALHVDNSDGHYQRACALARLHRMNEALASLTKAIERSPYLAQRLSDELDLKSLSNLPAFKKLLPSPEKAEP